MTADMVRDEDESEIERTRREVRTVRRAWSVLAAGSVPAAESLVNLATNARSELVRVQASTAILDRVGIGKVEGVVIADVEGALAGDMDLGGGASAAGILAARMRALQSAGGNVDVIRGQIVASQEEPADPEPTPEPAACHDCGYMPGDGDDPHWCTWCEAPIPDPRDGDDG